jgi:tripartite-type tricarboxylate transporter receptor subunit TctC
MRLGRRGSFDCLRPSLWRAIGALMIGALAVLGLGTGHHAASAQGARTIRVVVSVPTGGTIDTLVRILADHIGKVNGHTLIVESRPGAGGVIAAEAVARAAPDGNTLLINTNGMVINAILRKVNFDPLTSFEPICYLVSSPQVLVVNSASPYQTLGDLFAAARARPAELSLASVGPNTTQHIAIERLKRQAKINMTYVPFTGGAPAINALVGQHVTAALQNYHDVRGQLSAGTLRALATATARRIEPLPDLPTIAEQGYQDFDAEVWFGLVAPARTPTETVAQLVGWFSRALEAPEVKDKLAVQALYPSPRCGSAFAAHIRRQSDEFRRLIGELNLKGE